MNIAKKKCAILLILTFVLCAFVGCGSAANDPDASETTACAEPAETTVSSETTAPSETTETASETAKAPEDTALPEMLPFDREKHDEIVRAIEDYNNGVRSEEKWGYEAITVKSTLLFTNWITNPYFNSLQAGIFDGEYFYVGFARKFNGRETGAIGVFDRDGNYVKESEKLPIGHCNSISDLGNGVLLITNYDIEENARHYTYVDKETLTVLSRDKVNFSMLSLDYCRETGLYASCGIGFGETCRILDENKKVILTRNIDFEPGSAPQNFFCTANAIYAPRYVCDPVTGDMTDYIYKYSWTLGLQEIYHFEADPGAEVQSICIVDHKVYAVCGDHIKGTMAVYLLDIEF